MNHTLIGAGVIVIAVLFNPVVSSYGDGASDMSSDNCQALGEMFDSFMMSQTDETTWPSE